ncbi:MAG: ABC transporter ATP-binding protein [Mycoplasmataceae bacterium]|jgi:simple sugar transport system ATP-binding protein|nr:ABC transporter ATP-binding protein [Mycoplasmataceae bacterium]
MNGLQITKSKFAIEMINITKTFNQGRIIANKNINFKVKTGEIHAIVGENGAGKSTLMSILFGIYQPDSGKILVNGNEVHFQSAQDASNHHIGMVHQHFKLVNIYTLLENIILGAEITRRGFLDKKTAERKILALADQYNLPIKPNKLTSEASVGEQQRAEILKLLYRDNEILIFDEPTAVLSDNEIAGFLKMLLDFKKQGKTIILITHKLNEVKAVADRVSVIRKGEYVGTYEMKSTTTQELTNAMVGYKLEYFSNKTDIKPSKKYVLEVKNLTSKHPTNVDLDAVSNVSFNISEGEILGIAGIEGNGQTELALMLGGVIKPSNGTMILNVSDKEKIKIEENSIKKLYQKGISHVPEDRHKYGLILDETVALNVVTPQIDEFPFSKFGFLNFHEINNYAKYVCTQYDVRGTGNGQAVARMLSGGNQQKLVLGRELTRPHKLIVMVQPVRGLDIGAINMIHKKIVDDAKKGAAVILISYELDEILDISTRIMVFDRGKIVYESLRNKTDRAIIGQYLSRSALDANKGMV